MKRTTLFLLVATLLLAACTMAAPQPEATQAPAAAQETKSAPPANATAAPETAITPNATLVPRPVIDLLIGDQTVTGLPAASCWLESANDIVCQPDPADLTGIDATTITAGDNLTFAIQGTAGTPAAFYLNLLNEKAGGEPIRIDFGTVSSAQYIPNLEPGIHRMAVVAEYPLDSGDTSFVSAIFAIEVPQVLAEAPTVAATPTVAQPTASPAQETKPTEASAAMNTPTPAATTAAPTETPTEVSPTVPPSPTPPPPPTARPTEVPATAIPSPTIAPTEGPAGAGNIPEVIAVNGGQNYVPSAVEFCPQGAAEDACTEFPATAQSERILVANGDTIRIDLASPGPSSISLALANNSLSQELNRTDLAGSTIALYTVSGNAGNYILVVSAQWPNGVATYYFRLQIQG